MRYNYYGLGPPRWDQPAIPDSLQVRSETEDPLQRRRESLSKHKYIQVRKYSCFQQLNCKISAARCTRRSEKNLYYRRDSKTFAKVKYLIRLAVAICRLRLHYTCVGRNEKSQSLDNPKNKANFEGSQCLLLKTNRKK
jgi:hypothetical protein